MKYALSFFPTDDAIHPAELARAVEDRGFESLWLAEHSHIPVSESTPGPPKPGEPGLPREYYTVADPFVALAMAAQETRTLRLGTGVCLVAQRDVFQTAKQVASLDVFSQGRVLFGIGAGWNQPEIENHGTAFETRFAVMRERVEAMKRLWTDERAEYHGKHVSFEPVFAWPKPAQKPHPPVHIGGGGKPALRRVVRYGDGWIPLYGEGDDGPVELIPELRRMAAEAGRNAAAIEVSIYFCPPDGDVVARCRDAGVDRVLFPVGSLPRDDVLASLDEYAKLIAD